MWALFHQQQRQASALATYVVGLVSEQRKGWFRDRFNGLFAAWTPRFA